MRRYSRSLAWALVGFSLVGCSSIKTAWTRKPKSNTPEIAQDESQIVTRPRNEKPTAQMYVDFGNVQITVKNYGKAQEYFDRALAKDKKLVSAYVGYAKLHQAKQEWKEALAKLEKARSYAPEDSLVWNEIAVVQARTGNMPEAIAAMERVVAKEAGNAQYMENLAGMYAVAGNYERALELYSQAGDPADARYRVAGVLYSKGRTEEAVRLLASAVQMDPKHSGANDMLRKLTSGEVQQVSHQQPE